MMACQASRYFSSVTMSTSIHVRIPRIATSQYGKSRALTPNRSDIGGFSSRAVARPSAAYRYMPTVGDQSARFAALSSHVPTITEYSSGCGRNPRVA